MSLGIPLNRSVNDSRVEVFEILKTSGRADNIGSFVNFLKQLDRRIGGSMSLGNL